jgi:ketosteroid isomerase-like protein
MTIDRAAVERWVAGYERLWRTAGTDGLATLFTEDVSYLQSPWATPKVGLDAMATMWDDERDGPDEVFTMASEVLAVEGDTAVVRLEVAYGDPVTQRWRDLWVLRFAADGRCAAFEEWPFAPGKR